MRRSWAIMSAAAILLLSGAVAVAYPAAAATAGAAARSGRPTGPGGWVSPGGPGPMGLNLLVSRRSSDGPGAARPGWGCGRRNRSA